MYYVISETDTFSSTATGKRFKINQGFSCNNKCLEFLATCKMCNKQYTGQTTDSFRSRWNKHKSDSKKFHKNSTCMQKIFTASPLDVSTTFIDKTNGSAY